MHIISKTLPLAGLVAAVCLGTPATAQGDGDVTADPSNNATEVVCRRLPPPTGTRLGSRNVCKTQQQWDAEQAQYREEVQRNQDRSHQSFGNSGG